MKSDRSIKLDAYNELIIGLDKQIKYHEEEIAEAKKEAFKSKMRADMHSFMKETDSSNYQLKVAEDNEKKAESSQAILNRLKSESEYLKVNSSRLLQD